MDEEPLETPPPPGEKPTPKAKAWFRDHNKTQKIIWDDSAPFTLVYGEKGSGKTIIGSDCLVRHCFENDNALAVIVSPSIRTGNEGVLFDLTDLVLPSWRDGNRHPIFLPDGKQNPKAGELMDVGIGLRYTPPKLDPQTKDRHFWIQNMDGGWSKVIIISIPFEEAVEPRIKALSPSFVLVDELTQCPGPKYFTFIAAQLGRRRGIKGPQKWMATCNPEGPSHWVYKTFFEDCIDKKTGLRDPKYTVHHVPINENLHRLPPLYRSNLESLFKDSVDRARLLDGEWKDRPPGSAMFRDYYIPGFHVRGDKLEVTGLLPQPGFMISVGYDPGPVNFSVHFMQLIAKSGVMAWQVFDELNYVGKQTPYWKVVEDTCKTMDDWRTQMNHEFGFEHISDEAAFNQLRSDGSYDNREIERLAAVYRLKHPGPTIKLRACPKGKDSVPARVRMTMSMLQQEQLFVSALCPKTDEMLTHLSVGKPDPDKYDPLSGFRPTRSPYIHPFDSMTYPIFYHSTRGGLLVGQRDSEPVSTVYVMGQGR